MDEMDEAALAAAIEHRIAMLGLRQLVAEYEAVYGAFTDEEMAEAHAEADAAGIGDRRAKPSRSRAS